MRTNRGWDSPTERHLLEKKELYGAMIEGKGDEEVARRVDDILARIWDAEDWDAVIRSPKLMGGNDRVWEEWLARVASK